MLRLLLFVIIALAIGFAVFRVAQIAAQRSPARRRVLMWGYLVGLAAGLVLALWVPRQITETAGSPASLLAILVLWIVGGGLAFLSAASFLGTCFAGSPGEGK